MNIIKVKQEVCEIFWPNNVVKKTTILNDDSSKVRKCLQEHYTILLYKSFKMINFAQFCV